MLADELLASDLPDDPYLHIDLMGYFPTKMKQGFEAQIATHPLRREIIVTQVVNDLVNGAGMTFWPRLAGETGASAAELTRANFVAREIFASLELRDELKTYDNKLDADVQTRMRIEMRTLVERASRWLVNNRRPPLDSQATVDYFSETVQMVVVQLPELMTGRELTAFEERRDRLMGQGVPEYLASRVAVLNAAYMLLGLVEIANREKLDPAEVARLHFALGERLGLPVADAADPGPAPGGPVADDGPRCGPRRPHLGAHPAHRPGPAVDRFRGLRPRQGRRVGGRRPGRGHPCGADAGGDLRRRLRRPGPDVGRAPCRAWPAEVGVTRSVSGRAGRYAPSMSEPSLPGVAETVRAITSGQATAGGAAEAAIDRIGTLDPAFNAFSVVLADEARREALARDEQLSGGAPAGPLHGVPVAIKEEIDVAGCVTTFGGDANSTPARADAEIVRRLREAGAVIVGKTTMPEFGAFPYTESVSRGVTRNPWDPTRTPGGSSGGTAVAVATGMVPVGIGGDGGGSIRIPSACCGLFGLKPQRGRVTTAPHPHLWWALGTAGPLARSVLDSAIVYDVIRGKCRGRPVPRGGVGLVRRGRRPANPAGCASGGRRNRSPSASVPTPSTCRRSRTRSGCSPTSVTTSARSTRATPIRRLPSCRSSSPASAARPTWSSTTSGWSVAPGRPAGWAPG